MLNFGKYLWLLVGFFVDTIGNCDESDVWFRPGGNALFAPRRGVERAGRRILSVNGRGEQIFLITKYFVAINNRTCLVEHWFFVCVLIFSLLARRKYEMSQVRHICLIRYFSSPC